MNKKLYTYIHLYTYERAAGDGGRREMDGNGDGGRREIYMYIHMRGELEMVG